MFLLAVAAAAVVTPEVITGGGVAALLAGVKYLTSGLATKIDKIDEKIDDQADDINDIKVELAVIKTDINYMKD